MRRWLPCLTILVLVTLLLSAYGSGRFAWVAGPLAALVILALDHAAHRPTVAGRAPVRPTGILSRRREPDPVD